MKVSAAVRASLWLSAGTSFSANATRSREGAGNTGASRGLEQAGEANDTLVSPEVPRGPRYFPAIRAGSQESDDSREQRLWQGAARFGKGRQGRLVGHRSRAPPAPIAIHGRRRDPSPITAIPILHREPLNVQSVVEVSLEVRMISRRAGAHDAQRMFDRAESTTKRKKRPAAMSGQIGDST